jgi:hypothetical protein
MRSMMLLFLLGCVAATPVVALTGGGGVEGDWEAGLYVGQAFPDSYDTIDPDDGNLWGVRVGYFLTERWSVEGSWQTVATDSGAPGSPDVDIDSLRGNVLWNMRPDSKFRWFLTAGLGRESIEAAAPGFDEEDDLGWNGGGGARWYFGDSRHFGLRADARWVTADSQDNYEVTGGVLYSFGGGEAPDSDGDAVADGKDKCAGTPRGSVVDAAGCPKDNDGDRVADGVDKCPSTPTGWAVDATGCPADGDGDGIADVQDKCPGTATGVKADSTGCPVEDADGDSVWDGADRCPSTPKGVRVDPVGCPMDGDQDGVWDGEDRCPDTPRGTKVDPSGCTASAQ